MGRVVRGEMAWDEPQYHSNFSCKSIQGCSTPRFRATCEATFALFRSPFLIFNEAFCVFGKSALFSCKSIQARSRLGFRATSEPTCMFAKSPFWIFKGAFCV